MTKKFVVTGGPGFGKTTLLNELRHLGFCVVPEAARLVAGEFPGIEKSSAQFQELAAKKQMDLESVIGADVAFLDRGLPDALAYAERDGYGLPPEIEQRIPGGSP